MHVKCKSIVIGMFKNLPPLPQIFPIWVVPNHIVMIQNPQEFKITMLQEQSMFQMPCSSKSCNHPTPLTTWKTQRDTWKRIKRAFDAPNRRSLNIVMFFPSTHTSTNSCFPLSNTFAQFFWIVTSGLGEANSFFSWQ